jgi:ABC-2 type transport system permease protein
MAKPAAGRRQQIFPAERKKFPSHATKSKTEFLERSIPFVPEQSAALALATLRSLLRAPEVKMAWGTSLIVTIIIGFDILFARNTTNLPDAAKPFIATVAVVFPVFFLAQFFGNLFGFDRDGFRALMLSPADRRLILLGKNLAGLPVGIAVRRAARSRSPPSRLHLPPLSTVLATLFQLASLLLMAGRCRQPALHPCALPHPARHDEADQAARPGDAGADFLPNAVSHGHACRCLLGPLLEFLWHHFDWPNFVPVNLIASALFCGLMAVVYRQTLAPFGRLLQRREPKILGAITVEVE